MKILIISTMSFIMFSGCVNAQINTDFDSIKTNIGVHKTLTR